MVFMKNYYEVLGLGGMGARGQGEGEGLTQAVLRRAYKTALLGAHPDKRSSKNRAQADGEGGYTVDDVKEALGVLADEGRRREFDIWLAGRGNDANPDVDADGNLGADFVLGLETLDLSDFEASAPFVRMGSGSVSPSGTPPSADADADADYPTAPAPAPSNNTEDHIPRPRDHGEEQDSEPEPQTAMEWTRACRCGAEKGFRIQERELERAEERGEREVCVGCEGCSLWVRVGFDVEEG